MNHRGFTPTVFICHADKDKEFITRLNDDLKRCQINTWLDKEDIRVGEPWLEAIFEGGLPTVDIVFAYITEHSLESEMVSRELNSATLTQLKDGSVRILPFVQDKALIAKLRVDIQTLQCGFINEENYTEEFPRLVAEIWRSYGDRRTKKLALEEQGKRAALEARVREAEQREVGSAFSPSEESEFSYIAKELDVVVNTSPKTAVHFLPLFYQYFTGIESVATDRAYEEFIISIYNNYHVEHEIYLIRVSLARFGLSEWVAGKFPKYRTTPKHERFLFWLEYHNKVNDRPILADEQEGTP